MGLYLDFVAAGRRPAGAGAPVPTRDFSSFRAGKLRSPWADRRSAPTRGLLRRGLAMRPRGMSSFLKAADHVSRAEPRQIRSGSRNFGNLAPAIRIDAKSWASV